jgi:OOP family OmpA-OmpF porin
MLDQTRGCGHCSAENQMDDYDNEGPRRFGGAIRVLCVLALGVAGGFAIRPLLGGGDDSSARGATPLTLEAAGTTAAATGATNAEASPATDPNEPSVSTETTAPPPATTEPASGTETTVSTEPAETTEAPAETTEAVETTESAETSEPTPTTDDPIESGGPFVAALTGETASTEAVATTDAPETTEAVATTDAPETTEAVATTDAPEMTFAPMPPADPALSMALPTSATPDATVDTTLAPSVESTTPTSAIPYDTMPDGSPEPVIVTFAPDVITLTGAVPSAEASAFLSGYAAANSRVPGLPIDNQLVVNAAVPIGVGVRVIELESPRFDDGSAAIGAAHARQLDRVAAVMQSIPHLTVVVVGHADQRGSEASNLDLSQARADAVIAYLADRGVEGSRMSARAVGEADLLSTSEDVESLTLNRRTEFIFYGVLLTDPTTLTSGSMPGS